MTTPTTPKLPEPATGAMKVVAWWVEAIGLGQREKPHPSYNPEPLGRLSDAQALAGEVERLRAEVAALTADAGRLDYLQSRGATVEILPAGLSWKFQVGGFHGAVHHNIRSAIDSARAVATQEAK